MIIKMVTQEFYLELTGCAPTNPGQNFSLIPARNIPLIPAQSPDLVEFFGSELCGSSGGGSPAPLLQWSGSPAPVGGGSVHDHGGP